MKKCGNCFQEKPLSEFYRKLDRHQHRCKSCNAEVTRPYTSAAMRRRVLGESSAVSIDRARRVLARAAGES